MRFSYKFSRPFRSFGAALSPDYKQANARFFSHNFSRGQLKRPEWRRHFSQVTFRTALENAVCVALAHRKQRKRQSGNVMREKLPVLPLNICSAEKIFLRMAKNILRNVIHYVGMSKNPSQRLGGHLSFAFREGVSKKNRWIQDLAQSHLIPSIEILDTAETLEDARQKENQWVQHYHAQGVTLTNQVLPVSPRKVAEPGALRGVKRNTSEYTPFGLKIDELCLKRSISFHQLAARSGMRSHASILRACQGKSTPQRENILKWCEVLETSTEERVALLLAFHYTTE